MWGRDETFEDTNGVIRIRKSVNDNTMSKSKKQMTKYGIGNYILIQSKTLSGPFLIHDLSVSL
jgi:hypothetical protein